MSASLLFCCGAADHLGFHSATGSGAPTTPSCCWSSALDVTVAIAFDSTMGLGVGVQRPRHRRRAGRADPRRRRRRRVLTERMIVEMTATGGVMVIASASAACSTSRRRAVGVVPARGWCSPRWAWPSSPARGQARSAEAARIGLGLGAGLEELAHAGDLQVAGTRPGGVPRAPTPPGHEQLGRIRSAVVRPQSQPRRDPDLPSPA